MIMKSIERRDLMKGLGIGAVAVTAGSFATREVYAKTADADTYKSGKVTLKLPEIAENGRTVPLSVSVDSPMTDKNHVKAIHIVSEGNPTPNVISFNLTAASGKAAVSTRVRLGKTQNIQAAAVMNDGSVYLTKQKIKVTIGGCGG